jgi:hypothetical protein
MLIGPKNGCFLDKSRVKDGQWVGFPDLQQLGWQSCMVLAGVACKYDARNVESEVLTNIKES